MEESAAARAVMIGVSVFLSVSTISLVLMYYNTAKIAASNVGTGTDLAGNYTEQVLSKLYQGNTVNSTEMLNIINYYYGSKDTNISVNTSSLYVYGERREGSAIVRDIMFYQEAINNDNEIYGGDGRIIKTGSDNLNENVALDTLGDLEQVNNNNAKYNLLTNILVPFQTFKIQMQQDTVGRNFIRFVPQITPEETILGNESGEVPEPAAPEEEPEETPEVLPEEDTRLVPSTATQTTIDNIVTNGNEYVTIKASGQAVISKTKIDDLLNEINTNDNLAIVAVRRDYFKMSQTTSGSFKNVKYSKTLQYGKYKANGDASSVELVEYSNSSEKRTSKESDFVNFFNSYDLNSTNVIVKKLTDSSGNIVGMIFQEDSDYDTISEPITVKEYKSYNSTLFENMARDNKLEWFAKNTNLEVGFSASKAREILSDINQKYSYLPIMFIKSDSNIIQFEGSYKIKYINKDRQYEIVSQSSGGDINYLYSEYLTSSRYKIFCISNLNGIIGIGVYPASKTMDISRFVRIDYKTQESLRRAYPYKTSLTKSLDATQLRNLNLNSIQGYGIQTYTGDNVGVFKIVDSGSNYSLKTLNNEFQYIGVLSSQAGVERKYNIVRDSSDIIRGLTIKK